MSEATSKIDESFEASTERLSRIVDELEKGDIPLERALALFEEGVRLARSAEERIKSAERRVEELLGLDATGKPVAKVLGVRGRDDDEDEDT
ncbi:MAG TPA: exodeoxyribonuclease VII small subunit [Polyangiaceae bacterium]|jgi:exodeoxyribonuclease VII small subunit|nr:exodeoxyribonuclease VII small subunit [Polyangiaceae bacterium]